MLADESSLRSEKLHLVKPAVRRKAADPTKVVSTYRTLHVWAALILLDESLALRAVASYRPDHIGLPRLEVAVRWALFLAVVTLPAFAACLAAAISADELLANGFANV